MINKKEIKEKTLGYIITALGLVAGLAWNDAVKAFIEYAFPLSQNTLVAKFVYAVVVTLIVVVASSSLVRILGSSENK